MHSLIFKHSEQEYLDEKPTKSQAIRLRYFVLGVRPARASPMSQTTWGEGEELPRTGEKPRSGSVIFHDIVLLFHSLQQEHILVDLSTRNLEIP